MLGETAWDIVVTCFTLVIIASGIFLVSSVLASGVYSLHRNFVSKNQQHLKSAWVMLHAFCAFFASVMVTLWLSFPDTPSLPTIFKHCHSSHCGDHVPAAIDFSFLSFIFVFFILGMLLMCWVFIKTQQKKLDAQIGALLRLSPYSGHTKNSWPNATIIESKELIVLNVGLINPKILLSSHLTNSLNTDDIKLLLAYEYGKAKQFENLKIKLVQIMCLLWPSHFRSLLLHDIRSSVQESAYSDTRELLGSQQHTIPDEILTNLPRDVRQCVIRINSVSEHLADSVDSVFFSITDYLMSGLYFIFLVIVTSNLSHVLFELIG